MRVVIFLKVEIGKFIDKVGGKMINGKNKTISKEMAIGELREIKILKEILKL